MGVLEIGSARTRQDLVVATSRLLEEDLAAVPVMLDGFGSTRLESLEDIERCIDRLQSAMRRTPLVDADQTRVERLLSYLLVASIRARQLT